MLPTPTGTARSLAAAHPAATLPCPVCGVSLKAANLDGHLAKVHPGAADARPPWRGVDRRIVRTAAVALGLMVAGMTAALGASAVTPGTPAAAALVGVCVALSGLLFAAFMGATRATLTLDGDALVLRHSLGLGRRVARLPCAPTVGTIERPPADAAGGAYDVGPGGPPVPAGWYLQVGGVTVGCRQSTGFRDHWHPGGWRAGGRRMTYDVLVTREVMVAIEYALAARGALSPAAR